MDAAGIRDITIFAAFDESQRTCIAGACQELEVEEGATLTEQGEFGYAMFAVTSGTADVFKDGHARPDARRRRRLRRDRGLLRRPAHGDGRRDLARCVS